MTTNDRGATRRTKPSLALEAAALAYADALAAYQTQVRRILAAPRKPKEARINRLTTPRAGAILDPLLRVVEKTDRAMGRAAVALWKAKRRRGKR